MIARSLSLSLAQIQDTRIIAIFAKSMLITLVLTAALLWAFYEAALRIYDYWVAGSIAEGYSVVVQGAAVILGLLISGGLFRGIAVPVLSFFGDEVVAAVEERHYPEKASMAKRVGVAVAARLGLMSFARFLLLNLLALPVYVFLLFTAIGPIILFILLNGILLGRDLGEMVAVRHMDGQPMKQWLRNTRVERALLGFAVTGIFMIPLVNLIAPVLGAAATTHLFHGRRA